jgi:hypothetical protein
MGKNVITQKNKEKVDFLTLMITPFIFHLLLYLLLRSSLETRPN